MMGAIIVLAAIASTATGLWLKATASLPDWFANLVTWSTWAWAAVYVLAATYPDPCRANA